MKYSTKDKTTKKLKVSIKDIKNNILFIKKHDKNMINDKIKILKKDNNIYQIFLLENTLINYIWIF